MGLIRLDKYICDMGLASRREVKQLIRSGRVIVDGIPLVTAETKIAPASASVYLDGELLHHTDHHYYIIDKPSGVLTATEDRRQRTVMDLISPEMKRMGLFPVGRLDKDTSGLLILTDDGDFAHRVISPKSGIEKLYYARVDGIPDSGDVKAFEDGLTLADGTKCMSAVLTLLGGSECLVTVMEGKYHQVKRMLASRGKSVLELRRIAIGSLRLGEDSSPGSYCEISQEDIYRHIVEKTVNKL